MRLTLAELKSIIREAYDRDLMDDPAIAKKSVYVPDDVKEKIRRWTDDMGLTSRKKRCKRST